MRLKIAMLLMVMIPTLAIGLNITPALAAYGPKTANLLIHVYLNPDVEFEALEAGTIDIIDWYLSKYWVDRWTGNPDITMKSYSDIGIFEFDINNQRWPTGVTQPRTYDPLTDSYKHYYGTAAAGPATCPDPDYSAAQFRKAIAYLTDKDGYITRILKGYGARDDTFAPMPATAGWTDYEDLDSKGLIYAFNPAEAAAVLDAANFTQGSTPNPDYVAPPDAQYMRTDPRYGGDLQPLEFWIRMDDPMRTAAGWELVDQLKKQGIPVNPHETERTVCYKNVMVIYDFHLYTGGWSLSPDVPDSFHFLFHSAGYWGGTSTSYFGGVGWSSNYDGFAHNGIAGGFPPEDSYDYWAHKCKYPASFDEALTAGLKAQEIFAREVGAIPLWSSLAVKAYNSGWQGVVNQEGYGIDNSWSFLNMHRAGDDTIDYGFKSHVEGPNPISSEWVWDWNLIGLIYDSLLGRNPYNLAERTGWLAESWSTGTWMSGGEEALYALVTLRDGITFHNGDPVEPQDVKFSLDFAKACGPGVAWGYSDFMNVDHIDTADEDGTLGSKDVMFYFKPPQSYWALSWLWQPILNRRIWLTGPDGIQGTGDDSQSANSVNGWGYTYGLTDYNAFTNRAKVREYAPWESDVDADGIVDYVEDGAGPWKFVSAAPMPIDTATSIALQAYTGSGYYLTQEYISNYLAEAFHYAGDVNEDGYVDSADGSAIDWSAPADDFKQTAAQIGTEEAYWDLDDNNIVSVGDILVAWDAPLGPRHVKTVQTGDPEIGTALTLDRYPTGTGYDEFNPACDINVRGGDGWIDASDKYVWGKNKGKTP